MQMEQDDKEFTEFVDEHIPLYWSTIFEPLLLGFFNYYSGMPAMVREFVTRHGVENITAVVLALHMFMRKEIMAIDPKQYDDNGIKKKLHEIMNLQKPEWEQQQGYHDDPDAFIVAKIKGAAEGYVMSWVQRVMKDSVKSSHMYICARAVLKLRADQRETFIKWLYHPATFRNQADATSWIVDNFKDGDDESIAESRFVANMLTGYFNNEADENKKLRAANRSALLQYLTTRALHRAKGESAQVGELAELVYNIWTAKNRGVGKTNWRIRRNLYNEALKRGMADSWRKYIQVTLLGFKKSKKPSWRINKAAIKTLIGKVTKIEHGSPRKSWSAKDLYTTLKNYRDPGVIY